MENISKSPGLFAAPSLAVGSSDPRPEKKFADDFQILGRQLDYTNFYSKYIDLYYILSGGYNYLLELFKKLNIQRAKYIFFEIIL